MLKDKLLQLKDSSPESACMIGDFMKKMDKETKEAFIGIMQSKIAAVKISQILSSEGMVVSDNTVRRVRNKCFQTETPCRCVTGE